MKKIFTILCLLAAIGISGELFAKRIQGNNIDSSFFNSRKCTVEIDICSGVYTPSTSSLTNVDVITPGELYYLKIGNVVHVSGGLNLDVTTANTATRFSLSLPVARSANFDSIYDAAGMSARSTSNLVDQHLFAGSANNATKTVEFFGERANAGADSMNVFFTYRLD